MMTSLPAHWPCDQSLRVEFEGTGKSLWLCCAKQREHSQHCLLHLGSGCQGTQEDHGKPGTLEELDRSSESPEQKPTGLCRQGECKSPICLTGYTFHLQPRSARILLETMGFLIPVRLTTLETHSSIL